MIGAFMDGAYRYRSVPVLALRVVRQVPHDRSVDDSEYKL